MNSKCDGRIKTKKETITIKLTPVYIICFILFLPSLLSGDPQYVFLSDYSNLGYTIARCRLDGGEYTRMFPYGEYVGEIAVDNAHQVVYWISKSPYKIKRCGFDGSSLMILSISFSNVPGGIVIGGGKLYWTEGAIIKSANLDGSNSQDLVTGLGKCFSLAFDNVYDKLYYIGYEDKTWEKGHIYSADSDGSNIEELVINLDIAVGLAVDPYNKKLYWTSRSSSYNSIKSVNLDGTGITDLITSQQNPLVSVVQHIDIDWLGNKLYWTDQSGAGKTQRMNLDGTEYEVIHYGNAPYGIAVSIPEPTIYYVDADATGNNDGSSWADAYNDLQDALAAAEDGDEIRVAQGIYKPSELALPLPGRASNPNPADGATDVNLPTHLNWTTGDGADSYKIYIGTSIPPLFVYHQSDTIFYPGILQDYTTYYWRIDSINVWGETAGKTWSFTTGEMPPQGGGPGSASNPYPADGATDVYRYTDLSWTAGPRATSHDVYFGTSSVPPFIGNQTVTTFDPGTMDKSTCYYWRIDELNDYGTNIGEIWSFTTSGGEPPPPPPLPPPGFEESIEKATATVISREATFQLKNGVVINGGYAGFGEPYPNTRDIKLYETILSGDIGIVGDNSDNSFHVVTGIYCDQTAVLDGFTITAGNANGLYSSKNDRGGGIYCYKADPTLTNCTFRNNSAFSDRYDIGGGGIYLEDSSPTIHNCIIKSNSIVNTKSAAYGGGIHTKDSNPTITNCTISNNHGSGGLFMHGNPTISDCNITGNTGSGLCFVFCTLTISKCNISNNKISGFYSWGGLLTISQCIISGNSRKGDYVGGGGMSCTSSSLRMDNCIISNNIVEGTYAYGGGGMYLRDSTTMYGLEESTISNCTIINNKAMRSGGGIYCRNDCNPTFINCTISGNTTNRGGGGMYIFDECNPILTNCTIVGNSAKDYGGGIYSRSYSNPTLTNCILWDNKALDGAEIALSGREQFPTSLTISYSNIQGGLSGTYVEEYCTLNWGEGNIDADPCFVQPGLPSPISYWNFDEGSGTTAYDSTGLNHGTVYGAQWTTGQINEALSFDGLNDYVCVPDDYSLDLGTHDLSFAFWFKTSESSLKQILTKRSTTTGPSNRVWDGYSSALFEDGTVAVWFRHSASSDSGVIVNSTASYNDGNWHHLAGVYTRSANLELYVDGVPEGTPGDISYAENKNIDLTQPLAIGCRIVHGRSNDLYFNGTIDDVKFFDRAFSAEEIQQDYLCGLNGQAYPDVNAPDYHLLEGSPCINVGDPDYIPEPNETDLDGKPRVIGGRIDMGAYEFNHIPVADAGPDRAVEAQANWGATVTLDGSGSSDADSTPGTNDDITDFNWYEIDPCDPNADVLLGSGEIIDCNLSMGEHIIVLEVIDKAGASDTNVVTIIVQDTTPPDFELSVSPTILWPPDHKMVEITPSWTVSDECDETPDVSLVGIVANEGDDFIGDGHTSNDIQIGEDGSIYLRAERSGIGIDRIYTITYRAVDDYGNISVRSATVSIPHDFRMLARIASRWLWANPAGRIPEDLNGDGIVNLADFARFAENWIK